MPYSTADGVYESEFEYLRHQAIGDPYETHLSASEEQDYAVWKAQHAPNDSGEDYDFRGAFQAGVKPDTETGHWPDTFKKPNHPTFSNESVYARGREELAGSWNGNEYIPPGYKSPLTSESDLSPPREISREQAYSMGKDLLIFEHELRNVEVQDQLDPIAPGTPYNDRPTDQALARYFNETGNAHIYGLKDEEAALEFRGNGIRAWQYKDTPGYEPDPRYYPSPPEGFRKGLQQYNREYGTPSPIAAIRPPIQDIPYDTPAEHLKQLEQDLKDYSELDARINKPYGGEDGYYGNKQPPAQDIADVNRGRPIPQSGLETEGARGLAGGSKAMRQLRQMEAARTPDADEKIDKVAVRFTRNNHIESDRGVIHGELIDRVADKFRLKQVPYQEFQTGYLTNKGNFVTKEQAYAIAEKQGQMKANAPYSRNWKELQSEDVEFK